MPRRKQSKKEISLLDLADRGLKRITELSQSQLVSEKLQSVNILLLVFVVTVMITYFFVGPSSNDLTYAIFLVVSFILGLIISSGYERVLSIISNFSSNKIQGLRTGIVLLFCSLTIAIAALAFRVEFLITLTGILILVNLLVVGIGGVLFPKISVTDKEIKPSQIWDALGKISIITGIVGFIIDVVVLLIRGI